MIKLTIFGYVVALLLIAAAVLVAIEAEAGQHRSTAAKHEFMRQHPCPAAQHKKYTCPGYVIDHVVPLACGGADSPSNMQWQTIEEGKAKDKWERRQCH